MAGFTKEKKDPREDIGILNKIISSGEFKNIHLLFGEEDYLRNQFTDKLVTAMTGGEQSMNFDRFTGSEVSPEQIIDLAETMPFFSERRVILIEDSGWGKTCPESFAEYVKAGVCSSTCIVLNEKSADKRGTLYKNVSSAGLASEFMAQDENTLITWTAKLLHDGGIEISRADAAYMISVVGQDMTNIHNEAEKLIGYCLGKGKAVRADIDAICSRLIEGRIFAMVDALALKRQKEVLAMYYDLIDLREAPVKILVLITRQFDTLLKIKDMEVRRKSSAEIANATGKREWMLKNYRAQTSHYTVDDLKNIVRKCAELDENIKTGRITDKTGLEMLLVELTES